MTRSVILLLFFQWTWTTGTFFSWSFYMPLLQHFGTSSFVCHQIFPKWLNFFPKPSQIWLNLFFFGNTLSGNRWGDCGNGTSAEGCGPQETFRACSDISVGSSIRLETNHIWPINDGRIISHGNKELLEIWNLCRILLNSRA